MTIAQVLYALAVARCRNFSRAAESLFISQPALSLQIKKLEEEIGVPLFLRSTDGIRLTAEGERFYQDAQAVESAWERLLSNTAQYRAERKHLHIGMGTRVYSNSLFEHILRFFDRHPEIEVTFVTEAGGDFVAGVVSGKLELAIDRMPVQEPGPAAAGIFARELISEQQCVLAAFGHPLTQLDEVTFDQLQGCTIITGLKDSMEDRMTRQMFQDYGIVPKKVYRSDGIDTIMNLVAAGRGVALGPQSFAAYFGIRAVPLAPATYMGLQFICTRERANDPEIMLLLRHLLRACQQEDGRTGDKYKEISAGGEAGPPSSVRSGGRGCPGK